MQILTKSEIIAELARALADESIDKIIQIIEDNIESPAYDKFRTGYSICQTYILHDGVTEPTVQLVDLLHWLKRSELVARDTFLDNAVRLPGFIGEYGLQTIKVTKDHRIILGFFRADSDEDIDAPLDNLTWRELNDLPVELQHALFHDIMVSIELGQAKDLDVEKPL